MRAFAPLLVTLAAVLAGCSTAATPSASVGPSPAASASSEPSGAPSPAGSAGSLTTAAAKYRLIGAVGQPFFCDPDLYPVARADEGTAAAQHLPAIRADTPTWDAIAARLGLDPSAPLDQASQLAVYAQWKLLQAIDLAPTSGGWSFDVAVADASKPSSGQRIVGVVGFDGAVTVRSRTPAGILTCPICLARGTRIATPGGVVAVESLRLGDAVWTFGLDGGRIAGRVIALGSTPVPGWHEVVRLVLSDGRTLEASPGHPLLDGRPLGSLQRGDTVDGAIVVSATLVTYTGGATFDLLASGPTGGYLAGGVPLGSTIGR